MRSCTVPCNSFPLVSALVCTKVRQLAVKVLFDNPMEVQRERKEDTYRYRPS